MISYKGMGLGIGIRDGGYMACSVRMLISLQVCSWNVRFSNGFLVISKANWTHYL